MSTTFMSRLKARWALGLFVCVGLDSDLAHKKFPKDVPMHPYAKKFSEQLSVRALRQLSFNLWIIDDTKDLVCAYKPNLAFYHGDEGKLVLQITIEYIHSEAPGVVAILDAKQGDIDNTNDGYIFDDFQYYLADAVTVHNYLGREAMTPFLNCADKGVIVLCRTSNKGAGEFQDRLVQISSEEAKHPGMLHTGVSGLHFTPFYRLVAYNVSTIWNYNGNCLVVVGVTFPDELAEVRKIIGNMPILMPGAGAQEGDVEAAVRAGRDSNGEGMIINSSRGIIFASSGPDFAPAARVATQILSGQINRYRFAT